MPVGIAAVGVAVPWHRIPVSAFREVWGGVPTPASPGSSAPERTVLDPDGDTITLAIEAGRQAMRAHAGDIQACLFGTQTNPYIGRAAAAIVADALGLAPACFATDVQFSGRSGTSALILGAALIRGGMAESVLVLAADTLGTHTAPGDPAEHLAGSGGAALLLRAGTGLATLDGFASSASDTPDRYRLDGERYLRNGGTVMTATSVGYPDHAVAAWSQLGETGDGFAHLVTQPGERTTAAKIAKVLGFASDAAARSDLSAALGDTGAAGPLLGLARAISAARSGERIALVSYGSGAGCDALTFTRTDLAAPDVLTPAVEARRVVDYVTAVRYERRFHGHDRLMGAME